MREPIDTDRELPAVLDREAAGDLLANLVPANLADTIWDEIIAPLYDARAMTVHWQRGNCRRCHVDHPVLWQRHHPGKPWPGHRMSCPKYVGPLEHRTVRGYHGLFGWRPKCWCGTSWYEYDGDGVRHETCPDAAVDWRGPRPEAADLLGREEAQR